MPQYNGLVILSKLALSGETVSTMSGRPTDPVSDVCLKKQRPQHGLA